MQFFPPLQPIVCNICRSPDDLSDYIEQNEITDIMKEKHVCYQCAFWLHISQNLPLGTEIIDQHLFVIRPYSTRPFNKLNGHNGREFYIRKINTGQLIKSNNVFCYGPIPDRFGHLFQNTAQLLNLMQYQSLVNYPFQCHAKGCWDRYNCLRYKIEVEAKDGPYNIVPDTHVPGDEKCPSFIMPTKYKF